MNPTPTFDLSLSSSELAAINTETSLCLTEALLGLGRLPDALACSKNLPFEAGFDPENYYGSSKLSNRFGRLCDVALASAPDGISQLMACIAKRGVTMPEGSNTWRKETKHAARAGHLAFVGSAFDRVADSNPAAAIEMLSSAPSWACLQYFPHSGHHKQSSERGGLDKALSGDWPMDLTEQYMIHEGLCERLADNDDPCVHGSDFVTQFLSRLDPKAEPKAREPSILFLRRCIDHLLAHPRPHPKHSSPLPYGWMSALVLGPFQEGRAMVYEAFGRKLCLEAARDESNMSSAMWKAVESGKLEAIAGVFECFGAAECLATLQYRFSASAVASMAKSMDADSFGKALDLIIASGSTTALAENCAHRFWVVQEQNSTVRKLGDALAFCAAQGLIDHAQALLLRMPGLERKGVKEVLSYMRLRSAEKTSSSHAAWEKLLFREICEATPPPTSAPARRSRL